MGTSQLIGQVVEQLQRAGWDSADLILEPLVSHSGRSSRPDLVLLFKGYPLAVVEIRHELTALTDLESQFLVAVEALGVQYLFATDGREIVQSFKNVSVFRRVARWPRPEELWTSLNGQISPDDPRLASTPGSVANVRPHVAAAVARILDAVWQRQQQILVAMATGTGKTVVLREVISRLLESRRAHRILCVAERRHSIEHLKHFLAEAIGLRFWIEEPPRHPSSASVQLATGRFFEMPWDVPRLKMFPSDAFDFVIFAEISRWEGHRPLAEHFSAATKIGFTTNDEIPIRQYFGEAIFSYSIEAAVRDEEVQTPDGYVQARLGDFVEISAGRSAAFSRDFVENADEALLVRGADIQPSAAGLHTAEMPRIWLLHQHRQQVILRPGDIVMAAVGFTTSQRITLIRPDAPPRMVAASSVIRLRPREGVDPQTIVKALCSGTSRIALERTLPSLRGATRITTADLEGLRIFLPPLEKAKSAPSTGEIQAEPQSPGNDLGVAAVALRELRDVILPKLSHSVSRSDGDPDLQLMAEQLRKLAHSLAPPSLAERIIEMYPTPIALTYRRYHDARFNVFEQVLTLRDLFESVAFFVYNVMLADALRRLEPSVYYVEKKEVRRAYGDFSLPPRMDFIDAIAEKARTRSGDELFVPELAKSPVTGIIKALQREFRNVLSHTMAGSESQKKKVLERFAPRVEELLANMEFLSRYQLARIDSFHWQGDRLFRRVEVLQGVAIEIREERVLDGLTPTKAPRDHLVLLDEDDRVLDLHPLYQFLCGPQTHDQRHLCLFKRRSGLELHGESLFGAFEVILDGAQDFEDLRKRLEKEHPP